MAETFDLNTGKKMVVEISAGPYKGDLFKCKTPRRVVLRTRERLTPLNEAAREILAGRKSCTA